MTTPIRHLVLKTRFMVDSKHYLSAIGSSKTDGFTLIEALVAITILLLGVLGPLSVATRGITDGLIAKNQIVALGLAQEGIELVRTKVKTNLDFPSPWLTGLDGLAGSADCVFPAPDTCSVEPLSNIYQACDLAISAGTAGTCDLRANSEGIYITDESGIGTGPIFQRTIQIVKSGGMGPSFADGNIEAKVTVTVYWKDKGQSHNVVLSAYIYNPAVPSS